MPAVWLLSSLNQFAGCFRLEDSPRDAELRGKCCFFVVLVKVDEVIDRLGERRSVYDQPARSQLVFYGSVTGVVSHSLFEGSRDQPIAVIVTAVRFLLERQQACYRAVLNSVSAA
jgi:hypothetical protein